MSRLMGIPGFIVRCIGSSFGCSNVRYNLNNVNFAENLIDFH